MDQTIFICRELTVTALRLAALRLAAVVTGCGSDWLRQRLAAAATGGGSDWLQQRLQRGSRQRLAQRLAAAATAQRLSSNWLCSEYTGRLYSDCAVTACARVGAHVYTHVTPQASMASWSISNVPSSQNWKFIVLILFMIVETALVCWGTAFKVCYCPTF